MSIIVPSNHTGIGAWVNSKMSGRNPLVYCIIPLIAMQEYHTKTEDTRGLDYNSICYIISWIGWVSMRGTYKYRRCRRDPGKLSNNYCYTTRAVEEDDGGDRGRVRGVWPHRIGGQD